MLMSLRKVGKKLKLIVKYFLALLVGLIGLAGIVIIFVGPFSADTLQQSRLSCAHSGEVLTGHKYAIYSSQNVRTTDTFIGSAEGKNIMCKTSLIRRKIIELRVDNVNRVNDLEERDRNFNSQLDYFHNH